MTTSIELRAQSEELNNKAFLRLKEAESLKDATRASEIETEVNRMLADADALDSRAAIYAKAEEREKAMNAADARRPQNDRTVSSAVADAQSEQRAAFVSYLRGDISERELRAMNVATDAKGGFTAPSSTLSTVTVARGEESPMIKAGFVTILKTDNGNEIFANDLDDRGQVGSLIAEATEAPETDITLTQRSLGAFKYTSGKVLISNELIQDSNTDIVSLVYGALTQRIARIRGRHNTNGTGVNQPRGILTALLASAPNLVTTAGAKMTADELFALQHKVAPAYRSGGKFMLSDAALFEARTMRVAVTGHFGGRFADQVDDLAGFVDERLPTILVGVDLATGDDRNGHLGVVQRPEVHHPLGRVFLDEGEAPTGQREAGDRPLPPLVGRQAIVIHPVVDDAVERVFIGLEAPFICLLEDK